MYMDWFLVFLWLLFFFGPAVRFFFAELYSPSCVFETSQQQRTESREFALTTTVCALPAPRSPVSRQARLTLQREI